MRKNSAKVREGFKHKSWVLGVDLFSGVGKGEGKHKDGGGGDKHKGRVEGVDLNTRVVKREHAVINHKDGGRGMN